MAQAGGVSILTVRAPGGEETQASAAGTTHLVETSPLFSDQGRKTGARMGSYINCTLTKAHVSGHGPQTLGICVSLHYYAKLPSRGVPGMPGVTPTQVRTEDSTAVCPFPCPAKPLQAPGCTC